MAEHAIANGQAAKIRVIGFACERAYNLEQILNADGTLKVDPDVRIIPIQCSGYIQPIFIEKALDAGAQGAFVIGCVLGDCYYRDGNYIIKERIERVRRPQIKRKYNLEQIGAMWFSKAMPSEEIHGVIAQFKDRVVHWCQAHPEKLPAAVEAHEKALRAQRAAELKAKQAAKT